MAGALYLLPWLFFSSFAMANPEIRILSGERTTQEITQAIAARSQWFERAINNCSTQSRKGCDVTLELRLPDNTQTPSCTIASSTIKPEKLAMLYCSVAETLSLPISASTSTFTLRFNKQTAMDGAPVRAAGAAISTLPAQLAYNSESNASCSVKAVPRIRDSEDIRECFASYGKQLNHIYQTALRRDPTLQGTLRLVFTIDKDGHVSKMDIKASEISNQDFTAKMMAAVSGFEFGPAAEAWRGTHDLNFFPN